MPVECFAPRQAIMYSGTRHHVVKQSISHHHIETERLRQAPIFMPLFFIHSYLEENMSTHSSGQHFRHRGTNGRTNPAMASSVRLPSHINLFPESASVFVWLNVHSNERECIVTSVADAEGSIRSTQSHLLGVGKNYLRIYIGHLEPGNYTVRTTVNETLHVKKFAKTTPAIYPH